MYAYSYDTETGGLLLNTFSLRMSSEPRPVYYQELDILGFDKFWNYDKDDRYPLMWAEANNYYYRGRLVAKTKGGTVYTAPEIEIIEAPEPEGKKLLFVDILAMVEKNKDIIEKLAQDTIKKIYNTYVEYKNKVDIFYVAFSGGKDSIVTLDLTQKALPHSELKVLFGDTGMEFCDTYDTVDEVEKKCKSHGIVFLRAASRLRPENTWRIFGYPSQRLRWCCSVHKTTPQILLLRRYLNNPQFRGMAFTGIRGDESASRSAYDNISLGCKIRGQYSFHPIIEWNSAEVYIYIFMYSLILNETYKKGNSRAGCLVCPLATTKNMYFKEISYGKDNKGRNTTADFNSIILETTSKELSSTAAVKEFMNTAGWKARRTGKELLMAKDLYSDTIENGYLRICVTCLKTDWQEWIKTVGKIDYISNELVEIVFAGKPYRVEVKSHRESTEFSVQIGTNSKNDIYFMSAIKIAIRKAVYCICCQVCEANCPFGYITMERGKVKIDDRCIKCRKCHEISGGCLLAESLRLPKGDKKMGSIDRYGNMGIELNWVEEYLKKKDNFWENSTLGSKKIDYLRRFIDDSGITEKIKNMPTLTAFGKKVEQIGISKAEAWGLIISNAVYSSEFNWWVKNTHKGEQYTSHSIIAMLNDDFSDNTKKHVASAFKNIFISIPQLGEEIGLGVCDYEIKNNQRILHSITRSSWQNPDPRVVLYSLYKFAEACGDYYQFTLSRLLDHEIDADGVSPTEIFGIDRDSMQKIVNGLSVNYPEFISASFTLNLENITLNSEKSSKDVLELF